MTSALWNRAVQAEQGATQSDVAHVADSVATALWMGFPWFIGGSTQVSSGAQEDLADQVWAGQWAVPGSVNWSASCGFLTRTFNSVGQTDVEQFTAPKGPAVCNVTATAPGTSVSQTVRFQVWAAAGLSVSSPPLVTQGQSIKVSGGVVGLDPNGGGQTLTDLADGGRSLTLTVAGPSGSSTLSATDHSGAAHFTRGPGGGRPISVDPVGERPPIRHHHRQGDVCPGGGGKLASRSVEADLPIDHAHRA